MRLFKGFCYLVLFFSVAGCATSPPKNLDNICEIFTEKRGWYKDAKRAAKAWGSPIPIIMAFVHQESSFIHNAKPPRRKILGFIPGPRLSSSYGYSQAKDDTWRWYQEKSGNGFADRDDFGDATDFIAWYNLQSKRQNKIQSTDAYNLYLAYHEGHGGYKRKTYNKKKSLIGVATKVAKRSARYKKQYQGCKKKLDERRWFLFGSVD